MGNNLSFVKILTFLVPTLAIFYFLIGGKQDHQDVKMEKESASFDVRFNQMNGEMALDKGDKSFWNDQQKKANARLAEFEKKDHEKSAKNDATMREMEKELNKIKTEDLK